MIREGDHSDGSDQAQARVEVEISMAVQIVNVRKSLALALSLVASGLLLTINKISTYRTEDRPKPPIGSNPLLPNTSILQRNDFRLTHNGTHDTELWRDPGRYGRLYRPFWSDVLRYLSAEALSSAGSQVSSDVK
jgi:hypothetical protein